ncbi:hypothetical protein BC939DRAFT_508459 [Gamsiella multidivaricata]|uniref:uncharacterized protein n=1 Tax=Gamsiella multidivaricata TaxID=101098 RepID=UPI00221EF789|nr:uncharacterized protein BC939DRAFT_508459 [Gamsiella multidivaricata]KAI7816291.1 hypothetical protein BC939DRAFT_508459 [Gamsiella multidivaricata]
MTTYKQRAPFHRQSSRHSPDEDLTEARIVSSTKGTQSNFSGAHAHSHAPGLSSTNPSDEIFENGLDQEWTSIRHTASARVRARQQQYLHQAQQRAQEWHFVLGQYQRPPLSTASSTGTVAQGGISSDEYEDVLSGNEAASVMDSTCGRGLRDTTLQLRPQSYRERTSSMGQLSAYSYSDLPSEELEDLDESEDFSIWSQDDEDVHSTSTVSRPRLSKFASPYAASVSSTTSLNNMIHPSFGHHFGGGASNRIQNQMPFHDGSGNFVSYRSSSSQLGLSDHESDHGGWESSSSTTSSALKGERIPQSQQTWNVGSRRPVSSTEFDSVIHNIAQLQTRQVQQPHSNASTYTFGAHGNTSSLRPPLPAASVTHGKKSIGPSKLQKCSIYEAEMEDIDAMVIDIPSKQGWLQAFEQALIAFRSGETELDMDDSMLVSPIRALARHSTQEDAIDLVGLSKTLIPESLAGTSESLKARPHRSLPNSDTTNTVTSTRLPVITSSSSIESFAGSTKDNTSADMREVKQQISESSLETLQRLQKRHRTSYQDFSALHAPLASTTSFGMEGSQADPMHIHFSPTIAMNHRTQDNSFADSGGESSSRTDIVDFQGQTNESDSNLLTSVISSLRRFRDHVKSNLLHAEFDDDEGDDGTHKFLSGLGLEGDLGIEWATAGRGTPQSLLDKHCESKLPDAPVATLGRHTETSAAFFSNSRPKRAIARESIRRTGSDCGLESMLRDQTKEPVPNTATSF